MAGQFTGSSKRVEAHSKSSNLVVNSVALSRDLPVFTGFFEIIRVVNRTNCIFSFSDFQFGAAKASRTFGNDRICCLVYKFFHL